MNELHAEYDSALAVYTFLKRIGVERAELEYEDDDPAYCWALLTDAQLLTVQLGLDPVMYWHETHEESLERDEQSEINLEWRLENPRQGSLSLRRFLEENLGDE